LGDSLTEGIRKGLSDFIQEMSLWSDFIQKEAISF
jgi:hypothetical protein